MNYLKKLSEQRKTQIDGVEDFLSSAFSPVAPSQDFISYLGERLNNYPQIQVETISPGLKWYQYTLLAVITILGGGVILAFLIRIIISWVAWLSLLRQMNRSSQTRTLDA